MVGARPYPGIERVARGEGVTEPEGEVIVRGGVKEVEDAGGVKPGASPGGSDREVRGAMPQEVVARRADGEALLEFKALRASEQGVVDEVSVRAGAPVLARFKRDGRARALLGEEWEARGEAALVGGLEEERLARRGEGDGATREALTVKRAGGGGVVVEGEALHIKGVGRAP